MTVSLFVFISTQTNVYIHTHRDKIPKRPQLPAPPCDPPAAPFRRDTYCFAYASSLATLYIPNATPPVLLVIPLTFGPGRHRLVEAVSVLG